MANTSNTSLQPIDLNQLYGIDEIMSASQPSLENLNDYNRRTMEFNNTQGASTSQTMPQNTASMQGSNPRTYMQQDSMQSQPQRQEQTFPTSRTAMEESQFSDTFSQNESIQLAGDMQSFLRQQVGRKVSVQFLIGENSMVEQTGTLVGVGNDYIILRESNGQLLICHVEALKFVRVESS